MCGRAGFDQGLGDGLGGRRRLLPSQQRDRVGSERRERAPLDPPARPDHAAQRSRHQEPLRDPLGERHHIQLNAGQPDSTHAQTDAQSENILHPVTSASLSQVGVLSKRLDGSSWSLAQRLSSTYELHTHTHTHTFNGPVSGTTQVGRYQKDKTNLDFTEARDNERLPATVTLSQ